MIWLPRIQCNKAKLSANAIDLSIGWGTSAFFTLTTRLKEMWQVTNLNLGIVKSCSDSQDFEQRTPRIMPLGYTVPRNKQQHKNHLCLHHQMRVGQPFVWILYTQVSILVPWLTLVDLLPPLPLALELIWPFCVPTNFQITSLSENNLVM